MLVEGSAPLPQCTAILLTAAGPRPHHETLGFLLDMHQGIQSSLSAAASQAEPFKPVALHSHQVSYLKQLPAHSHIMRRSHSSY